MLICENIVKRYGAFTALDGVSMEVPAGKIFGLLGPNGAGKTTLIRIITRITGPDEGRVLLDGHPVIVDATFLRRADRDGMRQVAATLGVPCTLIDFVSGADLALMRQRLRERTARGDDASEADEQVLETQLRRLEPLGLDERALALREA